MFSDPAGTLGMIMPVIVLDMSGPEDTHSSMKQSPMIPTSIPTKSSSHVCENGPWVSFGCNRHHTKERAPLHGGMLRRNVLSPCRGLRARERSGCFPQQL